MVNLPYAQYSWENPALAPEPDGGLRFALFIDWNGDGLFSSDEIIQRDLVSFSCQRGRDDASQLTGRSKAGAMVATLLNYSGDYSRFNAASPISGDILPARRVALFLTVPITVPLWTGLLDTVDPEAGGVPRAIVRASGTFARLQTKVAVTPMEYVMTSDAVEAILDRLGWPADERIIGAGVMQLGRYFPGAAQALGLLRKLEQAEDGFIYEGRQGEFVFENRYHREINSVVSVATFSDDPGDPMSYLDDIKHDDPLRRIFNHFEETVPVFTDGAEQLLWELSTPVSIPAGQSRTFHARMPSGFAYVKEWTWINLGRDGTVADYWQIAPGVPEDQGDVVVTVTPFADAAKIVVENVDVADHVVTLAELEGIPVAEGEAITIESEDATSIATFGQRDFPFDTRILVNPAYAQANTSLALARNKDPRPYLQLSVPGILDGDYLEAAVTTEISDRITITANGLRTRFGLEAVDFYVESIGHSWEAETGIFTTRFVVSPADAAVDYFTVGASLVGGTDVVAP